MRQTLTLFCYLLTGLLAFAQRSNAPAAAQSSIEPDLFTQAEPPASVQTEHLYWQAFAELKAMLEGKQKLSFKRAVFLTENVYLENKLPYELFQQEIDIIKEFCRQQSELDRSGYKNNWLATNGAIFKFITDTTYHVSSKGVLWHYPYRYNFEDYTGEKDWRKMFVSHLLFSGEGNCHSLPFLYRILAEEFGTEAYLSLAPNHVFIKHRNDADEYDWFNVELTSGTFPHDAWLMASGYITRQSIISGMYLDTLDLRQSVALCLVDLAKGYERKFTSLQKLVNETFVIECAKLALAHHPQNINAKLLWVETLHKRLVRIMQANGLITIETVHTLPKAKTTLQEMEKLYGEMEKAGYREMPKAMYLHWLATVKNGGKEPEELKNKQLFDTQDGNPFRNAGYYVPVLTLSNGKYQEFQRDDTLLRMGSAMYNRFTRKVAYLLEKQARLSEANLEPEVVSRWFSIDPLAEKYYTLSPYAYVANNPLKYIDPNGKEIWINYGDNQRARYDNGKLYNEDGSKYKGKDAFVNTVLKTLNNINDVKAGKTLLGSLSKSENDFTFTNTASSGGERTLSFEAHKGGGGEIHAKALGLNTPDSQKAENASHELFHGYQWEHGETGATVNREVAAYLFGRAIGFQVGMKTLGWAEMPWGKNNAAGKAYEQAMSKLLFANKFDPKLYKQAVDNFKAGAAVNTPTLTKPQGLYNGFRVVPNDNTPSIMNFFPLIE